jgi:hypothetical protein
MAFLAFILSLPHVLSFSQNKINLAPFPAIYWQQNIPVVLRIGKSAIAKVQLLASPSL